MTRPERLKTSLTSLGTKLFVSVCRSASVAPLTPTYHLWSPTGDKVWYLYRGKFAAVLHHAFHLGLTNEGREDQTLATSSKFLAPLPGTPSAKIGELHTTLYPCFLVLLVYLSVFIFESFIKNHKQKSLPHLLLLWVP